MQAQSESVLLGIDNLQDVAFAPITGKKIALLTNSSGRNSRLEPTARIFASNPQIKLSCILAPEHGYFATTPAGQDVNNDTLWNVPVYSLYGKYRRPTRQMLADADIVVVDIQDIGIRSYTFISSVYNVLDACAEYGKEVYILDRPNPLGGLIVDGSVADSTLLSFVCIAQLPYIHGLTIGEFALMVNGEGWLPRNASGEARKCHITVVKMRNWRRSMRWEDTGLQWPPTSPNIPTISAVRGVAITGILGEMGIISIGMGTTLPFQYIGAPGLNADTLIQLLSDNFEQMGIYTGIARYRPSAGKYTGQECNGILLFGGTGSETRPFSACIELLLALRKIMPQQFTAKALNDMPKSMLRKVISNNRLIDGLLSAAPDDDIRQIAQQGRDDFYQRRTNYLLYPEY